MICVSIYSTIPADYGAKTQIAGSVHAFARAKHYSRRTEDAYVKTTQIYMHVIKNKSFVKSPSDV